MQCNNIQSNYYNLRIRKIRSKRFKKIIFSIVLLSFIILSLVFYYIHSIVNPIIYSYSKIEVDRLVSVSGNDAISQISSENLYNDFIKIEYSSDGYINSIKADIEKINRVSNILAQRMQSNLDNNTKLGIKIPIGTLSGISLLMGKGEKINFSINPIGSSICNFHTSFTSAGINQTSHKIYVSILSNVSLILPFKSEVVASKVDYLISECLIVGKVPNTYLNITDLQKLNSL